MTESRKYGIVKYASISLGKVWCRFSSLPPSLRKA
jgi:hypothetical protein